MYAIRSYYAVSYLKRLAKGEIPSEITDDYPGDYNDIKLSVNGLVVALNNATLIAEQISVGNLNNEIKLRSDDDKLMIALDIV